MISTPNLGSADVLLLENNSIPWWDSGPGCPAKGASSGLEVSGFGVVDWSYLGGELLSGLSSTIVILGTPFWAPHSLLEFINENTSPW